MLPGQNIDSRIENLSLSLSLSSVPFQHTPGRIETPFEPNKRYFRIIVVIEETIGVISRGAGQDPFVFREISKNLERSLYPLPVFF